MAKKKKEVRAKKQESRKKSVAKKKSPKKTIKKVVKKPVSKKKATAGKKSLKKAVGKKRTTKRPRISNLVYQTSFKTHVTSFKEGDVAPFFVGHDQRANQVSLNDFTGKTLVLYFYPKDDTSGCTAQSCSLRDEYKYLTLQNYAVVGVSADDVKSHKKFADKFSLPFPLIADVNKDMIKAYDVWGKKMLYGRIYDGIVRTTFIIKDGIIDRVISAVDTEGHGKQVMGE